MNPSGPDARRHRNDTYGEELLADEAANDAIPAATVVLLRDAPDPRVLMLRKTSEIAFGGMWVFPGGRIDSDDHGTADDLELAARNAAARETREEAGIVTRPEDFVWFSHWTPPPVSTRRFATWFFAARADSEDVVVDGGEIDDHAWLSPRQALQRHAAGEIDLVPPTWITLYQLSLDSTTGRILERLAAAEPKIYQTRLGTDPAGHRVTMWEGDAGYEAGDASLRGDRHRLIMKPGGFVFENTRVRY